MTCPTCQSRNSDTARFCTGCGAALDHAPPAATPRPPDAQTPASGYRAASLIGQTLDGKYRVDARLSEGGMGIVYRATRLGIGDTVALKVLRAELLADPQAFERFRREAQAAARLKHPNVVTIHDFGITVDGTAYLVMEMVEGQSLRSLIQQQGRLSQAEAVQIAAQVCDALDDAHRQRVIHRDLKPDNIIVARATGGLRVKVLDFGIAKLADPPTGDQRLTQSGTMLGTPVYMSPEQCLGEPLDGRSDIYSLGIVLYEMLSGTVPFNSPSMGALIIQQVQQAPPPLRENHLGTSPALEAAVQQALQKRPEARPQSAAHFAEMLWAALNSAALTPTLAGTVSFGAAQSARESMAFAPTVAGVTPLSSGRAAAPARVVATSKGRKPSAWLVGPLVLALVAGVAVWRLLQGGTSPAGDIHSPNLTASSGSGAAAGTAGSVDRTLTQAESDFRSHRYEAAIAACASILASAPDQARANLLLGESYYYTGASRAALYLGKAIDLGETATLEVKHHHYDGVLKLNDGFCSGSFRLSKGRCEFHSDDVSEHSFVVTPDKLYDLRDESYKGGRLHLRAGVDKGGTEVIDNYNFYAPTAGLRKQMTFMKVYCENPACQPMAQTLYQLLAQLKR